MYYTCTEGKNMPFTVAVKMPFTVAVYEVKLCSSFL